MGGEAALIGSSHALLDAQHESYQSMLPYFPVRAPKPPTKLKCVHKESPSPSGASSQPNLRAKEIPETSHFTEDTSTSNNVLRVNRERSGFSFGNDDAPTLETVLLQREQSKGHQSPRCAHGEARVRSHAGNSKAAADLNSKRVFSVAFENQFRELRGRL